MALHTTSGNTVTALETTHRREMVPPLTFHYTAPSVATSTTDDDAIDFLTEFSYHDNNGIINGFHQEQEQLKGSFGPSCMVAANDINNSHHHPHDPSLLQQQQCLEHQQQQQGEKGAWIPNGWTVGSRRRSLLELETNIRTLGELYRTLSDIRHQLPSPVATAMEQQATSTTTNLCCNTNNTQGNEPTIPYAGGAGEDTPASIISSPGTFQYFAQQLSQYPPSVFDALVRLHLRCTSYLRIDKARFLESYYQGNTHPALICALYAYSAIHAMICHPDQFGIYPFMDQLARDCYRLAHELVEFDCCSKTTIETLVLMHLYLVATGDTQDNHRNLLSLADRHTHMLLNQEKKSTGQQDLRRLRAWMLQADLLFAMRTLTAPVIQYTIEQSDDDDRVRRWLGLQQINSQNTEERLQVQELEMEIEGLLRITTGGGAFQDGSSPALSLDRWREKVRKSFRYHQLNSLEDRCSLRLHAIYFAGKLQRHQSEMMQAFARHHGERINDRGWTDYFHEPTSPSTADQVETALMESMRAGFGLVQVVWTFFQANDRCMIIELLDTLSAAFSVLYFGNKMVQHVQIPCYDAMIGLINAFASSPSMMQCLGIKQFVEKWNPPLNETVSVTEKK
ncbi:hypothetical protein BDA99DRAFT_497684 [Phascolomyces articulosus]|uniref:Transcription factor domain-containing protein n=1 Tax=Phascolomyces articulosus TaxID=60185 RepID=A0AAD5PHZ5_9FUNG|nr:hypothetical protein BDA99DRAFT_497684 [Phascolomyces articulosus]